MKKLFIQILILLVFFTSNAQNKNIEKDNQGIVTAEASIIIPIGDLANKFEYGHSYGFWFNLDDEKKLYIKPGINFIFLQNARNINYEFKNDNYTVESNKFGVDVGIKIGRQFYLRTENKYFDIDAIFGIHYLDYQFPSENEDDKKSNKDILPRNATLLIAPQIGYNYKNVGIKLQYRFAPLSAIKAFESNFGDHSIDVGIVYKQ